MARGTATKESGWREFERDLYKMLDRKTIFSHLRDHHEAELINAVIGTAKAGIGPGNQPYAGYSASYRKQIEKAGGVKFWLRGIGTAAREGGMLEPGNFQIVVKPNGECYLEWTADDEQMRIYGNVHQGTAHGGEDDTRKKTPPRPWLHFENQANVAALIEALGRTFDELAAMFNAGRTPK